MKTFKSEDKFDVAGQRYWMIRRPDAYQPKQQDEIPKAGEHAIVDGDIIIVGDAYLMGDSEFKYYPHLLIKGAKMSTTPRTDAALANIPADYGGPIYLVKTARELEEELNDLARWKREMLTVESWWKEIDSFIRKHPEAKLGQSVSAIALEWLKERDELKRENERMRQALDDIHIDAHCAAKAGPLSIPTLDVAWRRFMHISARATSGLSK